MKMTTISAKRLTFEDYMVMPEIMKRYEIIDGELSMPPAPTFEHQWNVSEINDALKSHVRMRQLGVVLFAPLDVMIRRTPLRTRQPDILFISIERLRAYGLDSIENVLFLEIPPDLAVEIISPSETQQWIAEKLADYQRIGVKECWLARPDAKTVEVIRLTTASIESTGVFKGTEQIQSSVLPELALTVDRVFAPPDFLKW
jgi:Uma2 family endonuclease